MCGSGFSGEPSIASVKCGEDGKYTTVAGKGTCKVPCPVLPVPDEVALPTACSTPNTLVGAECKLQCAPGWNGLPSSTTPGSAVKCLAEDKYSANVNKGTCTICDGVAVYQNRRYEGGTVSVSENVSSASVCCGMCKASSTCFTWTYTPYNQCYLKTNLATSYLVTDAGYTSGQKFRQFS
jgi:hypothetical protein